LFDKSCPPGQTAKLFGLSAAGFNLALGAGRENQGHALGRDEFGGFPPERGRGDQDQQKSEEKFFHGIPRSRKIINVDFRPLPKIPGFPSEKRVPQSRYAAGQEIQMPAD